MSESTARADRPDTVEQGDIVAATRHWLEVAVIGLNLCPFAKAVHVKHQIRYAVTQANSDSELLAVLRDELSLLAKADANDIDTTLLIHPQALTDFIDYTAFLRQADRLLRSHGHEGTLQIASFHPAYEFAGSAPDDIENCSNRSPYPMLHLLREDSIERAVAAFPDAGEIYERNIETLRRLGHTGWQRLFTQERISQL
jgi:hypothetical protein